MFYNYDSIYCEILQPKIDWKAATRRRIAARLVSSYRSMEVARFLILIRIRFR